MWCTIAVGAAMAAACAEPKAVHCGPDDGTGWECQASYSHCLTPTTGYCANDDDWNACGNDTVATPDFTPCASKHTGDGACLQHVCTSCSADLEGCTINGWQPMTSPFMESPPDLLGVWVAPSPSFEAYAVGTNGTIIQYDGTRWSVVSSPTSNDLHAVWGSSMEDVYAVGKKGTIVHYDGTSWTATTQGNDTLASVWGSGPMDVYGVGGYTIVHFDGAWHITSSPPLVFGVWGSDANNVYLAAQTGVLHGDGSTAYSSAGPMNALWGDSANDIYAVGGMNAPSAASFDGTAWLPRTPPDAPFDFLESVWGSSSTDVYSVSFHRTLYHYATGHWSTNNQLMSTRAVGGRNANDVFLVGFSGAIWRCGSGC